MVGMLIGVINVSIGVTSRMAMLVEECMLTIRGATVTVMAVALGIRTNTRPSVAPALGMGSMHVICRPGVAALDVLVVTALSLMTEAASNSITDAFLHVLCRDDMEWRDGDLVSYVILDIPAGPLMEL